MKGQVSPFAALTGEEKQLKWLEYQSIRLPYTETAVESRKHPSLPPRLPQSLPPKAPASSRKRKNRPLPSGRRRRNRRQGL